MDRTEIERVAQAADRLLARDSVAARRFHMTEHIARVFMGGKKQDLVYNTKAIRSMEEIAGMSFEDIAEKKGKLSFIVIAVAGGLVHDPDWRARLNPRAGEWTLDPIDALMDGLARKKEPEGEAEETLLSLGQKIGKAIRFGAPGVSIRSLEPQPAPAPEGTPSPLAAPAGSESTGTG